MVCRLKLAWRVTFWADNGASADRSTERTRLAVAEERLLRELGRDDRGSPQHPEDPVDFGLLRLADTFEGRPCEPWRLCVWARHVTRNPRDLRDMHRVDLRDPYVVVHDQYVDQRLAPVASPDRRVPSLASGLPGSWGLTVALASVGAAWRAGASRGSGKPSGSALSGARNKPVTSAVTRATVASCTISACAKARHGQPDRVGIRAAWETPAGRRPRAGCRRLTGWGWAYGCRLAYP